MAASAVLSTGTLHMGCCCLEISHASSSAAAANLLHETVNRLAILHADLQQQQQHHNKSTQIQPGGLLV